MPDSPEKFESKQIAQNEDLETSSDEQEGFGNLIEIVESGQENANSNSDSTAQSDGVLTDETSNLPELVIGDSESEIDGVAAVISNEVIDSPERGSELKGEAREEHYSIRFVEVTGQESVIKEGPEKELNNWADSWKDFVEEVEVPEGDFRDLLQAVGAQMILGEFDQSSLAGQMSSIEISEDLQSTIDDLNKFSFRNYGVKLDLKFDKRGKLNSLELKALQNDGKTEALLKVSSKGKVEATGKDEKGKPLSQEDAVKKVARKASPLACP